MTVIWLVVYFVTFLFLVVLGARLVLSWVQAFSPDWRPRGPMLVVAEVVYTITDPPLKAVGRVLPPIRIGNISLDLAFMAVGFAALILYQIAGGQL